MSISYYVCIGEGFFVPRDKMEKFHDDFPEIYESYEGEEYITDIDPMCGEKDYFVGVGKWYEIMYNELPIMTTADIRSVISLDRLDKFREWFPTIKDKLGLNYTDCRTYLFPIIM